MSIAATSPQQREVRVARKGGLALFSARSRGWALGLLLVAAFAFGGGARGDITSLIVLRPLSFALLAYALLTVRKTDWMRLGIPGWLVPGIAVLCVLQLVPLPPAVWTALPGRELPAEIAATLGWSEQWRPLSLAPARTLNTLFALALPLASLALLAGFQASQRSLVLWLILALGVASALLGLAQIIGAPDGPLYFYQITNEGLAVGLFSNRNHHAAFLASLVPLLGYVALRAGEQRSSPARSLRLVLGLGGIAFAVPMVLVTGSRAGTALVLTMGFALAVILWVHKDLRPADGRSGIALRKLAAPGLVGAIALLAAITHFASRSLSFERFASGSMDTSLRSQLFPHLLDMARDHFPVGTGFGAFRQAWEVIEPRELLRPQYLNQAHNDVLQFVIEGGLPALLLLLLGLFWFAGSGLRAWQQMCERAGRGGAAPLALFAWLSLATLLAGSVFDYPLRTPSLMAVAALLAGLVQLSLSSPRDPAPAGRSIP